MSKKYENKKTQKHKAQKDDYNTDKIGLFLQFSKHAYILKKNKKKTKKQNKKKLLSHIHTTYIISNNKKVILFSIVLINIFVVCFISFCFFDYCIYNIKKNKKITQTKKENKQINTQTLHCNIQFYCKTLIRATSDSDEK